MVETAIYGIVDVVAKDLTGGLHLHRHDAAAIRMFIDVAQSERTAINRHPADYELQRFGVITKEGTIKAYDEPVVVITGKAWLATNTGEQADGTNNRA